MIFNNYNLPPNEFNNISSYLKTGIADNKIDRTEVIFVRISDLKRGNRWELRKAINNNIDSNLILLSANSGVAKFAWKIQTLQFLSYPVSTNQLNILRLKLNNISLKRRDEEKLKINFEGGFHMIHPSEISLIQGKGNYCRFFFKEKKSIFPTARISKVYKKIQNFPYLIRINKSLVINVNHLTKIENGTVFFIGESQVQLKLNRRVVSSIKKELLWL